MLVPLASAPTVRGSVICGAARDVVVRSGGSLHGNGVPAHPGGRSWPAPPLTSRGFSTRATSRGQRRCTAGRAATAAHTGGNGTANHGAMRRGMRSPLQPRSACAWGTQEKRSTAIRTAEQHARIEREHHDASHDVRHCVGEFGGTHGAPVCRPDVRRLAATRSTVRRSAPAARRVPRMWTRAPEVDIRHRARYGSDRETNGRPLGPSLRQLQQHRVARLEPAPFRAHHERGHPMPTTVTRP